MARINIEEKWFSDPRRSALACKLGSEVKADGVMIIAIRLAQQYWIPNKELIPFKSWNGVELPEELVSVGLAEKREKGYYVSGSEEHFSWWFKRNEYKKEAGKIGGRISAQRPRDNKGKLLPKQNPSKAQAESKQSQSSSSSSSYTNNHNTISISPIGEKLSNGRKYAKRDEFIKLFARIYEDYKKAPYVADDPDRKLSLVIVSIMSNQQEWEHAIVEYLEMNDDYLITNGYNIRLMKMRIPKIRESLAKKYPGFYEELYGKKEISKN